MKKLTAVIILLCVIAFSVPASGAFSPEYADDCVLLRTTAWDESSFTVTLEISRLTKELSECVLDVTFDPDTAAVADLSKTKAVKQIGCEDKGALRFVLNTVPISEKTLLAEIKFAVTETEISASTDLNVSVSVCKDTAGEDVFLQPCVFGRVYFASMNKAQRNFCSLFRLRFTDGYIPVAPGSKAADIRALLADVCLTEAAITEQPGDPAEAGEIRYGVSAKKDGFPKKADEPVNSGDTVTVYMNGLEFFTRSVVLAGDVSGNGRIEADDARLTLRAAVGLDTLTGKAKTALGGLTGNGEADPAAARAVLRFAVGLDSVPAEALRTVPVGSVSRRFRLDVFFAAFPRDPETVLIRTYEEFLALIEEKAGLYENAWGKDAFFAAYPKEFFDGKTLALTFMEEGSGSYRHKTSLVCKNGNGLTVIYDRLCPVGAMTEDMAYLLLCEEIADGDLAGITGCRAVFDNIYTKD